MMQSAETLESRHAAARKRTRQNKQDPLLICLEDGALFPNVPNIQKKPNFIVYQGDPNASLDERMAYVRSMKGGRGGRRGVTNSLAPFDIGKATKEELFDFALTEYDTELKDAPLMVLRKQVQALAEKFDAMLQTSAAKTGDDIS